MLILQFQAGSQWYAADARTIIEVVPWVDLRPAPHAPDWIAGHIHYRGLVLPVIDFGTLLCRQPCERRLNTRILIVDGNPLQEGDRIGILAERVTEIRRVDAQAFRSPGLGNLRTPFLGDLVETRTGLAQLVRPDRLPAALRERTLGNEGEPG